MIINNNLLNDKAAAAIEASVRSFLCRLPSPIGALMVGYDGKLIANFLPEYLESEPIVAFVLKGFRASAKLAYEAYDERCFVMVLATTNDCVVSVIDIDSCLMVMVSGDT